MGAIIETRGLNVWAGSKMLLRNINIQIQPGRVFGIIGPSGAGKSTLLKSLNRLIELDPTLRSEGEIFFNGSSIFKLDVDVDALRARVGIIFQQPVVFPVSIYKNVIFGLRHLGLHPRNIWPSIAEKALAQAGLWDEVRGRFHEPANKLSVGQQQRLCLARTLAVSPKVILMDEPTSSLDPASTQIIEELILRLKQECTIILVTHNMGQATRVADEIASMAIQNEAGEVVACGLASEVMGNEERMQHGLTQPAAKWPVGR